MNTKYLVAMIAMVSVLGISSVSASEVTSEMTGVSAKPAPIFDQVKVTNVEITKPVATIGEGFENGWAWKFTLQIPCAEKDLYTKFGTWCSSNYKFSSDKNVQFSIDNKNWVPSGSEYGKYIEFKIPDDCKKKEGYSASFYVQTQVPEGATAGEYSSTYGITTK